MGAVERLARKRAGAPPPTFTQEKGETEEPTPATQSAAERIMWTQQTFGNRFVQQRATSCPDLSACPTGGACEKCQQQQAQTKLAADRTKDPEEEKDPKEAEAEEIERRAEELPEDKTAGKLSVAGRTEAPRVQRACDECEKEEEETATATDQTLSNAGAHDRGFVSAPMSPPASTKVEATQPPSSPAERRANDAEPQNAGIESNRGTVVKNAESDVPTPRSNAQAPVPNVLTPGPIREQRPNATSPSTSTLPSAARPQSSIGKVESPNESAPQPSPATGMQGAAGESNRVTSGTSEAHAEREVQRNAESNQQSVKENVGAETHEETEADGKVSQTTSPVVVEDSAEVAPGQMHKSEFIAEVQAAARETADEALKDTCRSAQDCPYIDYWINYYRTKDSQHIQRALRKYVPAAAHAATADEAIGYIREHVRQAVEIWVSTGEITGVPEGVPMSVPGEPPAEQSKSATFRRKFFFKGRDGGAREADDPQAIQSRLGSGRPLEGSVKSRMESAFGRDFSAVRVHTDAAASDLSAKQNARAFTVGEDVAFGAGEYKPGTPVGDALLAHELAHVVQQGGAVESEGPLKKDATEHGAMEEDADNSAVGAVVSLWSGMKGGLADVSRSAMPRLKSGLSLQRCNDKSSKKCTLKSGPTYTPSGTQTPSAARGTPNRGVDFTMAAEFDQANASCCEARQYIRWTSDADRPNTAGYRPAASYAANTWYEDRTPSDQRYGHRSGPHSIGYCGTSVNDYKDASGTSSCASGHIYSGSDAPRDGSGAKTGDWEFALKVVDICNGEAQVGSDANVTVDW